MTVKATDHIPFMLVLPDAHDYAATPVVIFQHGINGDRSAVLTVANSYAARGYATLGIDELWHGSPPARRRRRTCSTSRAQPGHDGIGDPDCGGRRAVLLRLRRRLDARASRPSIRATSATTSARPTIDLMQEVRLARGGDLSEVAAAMPALAGLTLDGGKLVYTGESFGSILGARRCWRSIRCSRRRVLDVGGGGLIIDLAPNAPQFATLLQPFIAGAFDTEPRRQPPRHAADARADVAQPRAAGDRSRRRPGARRGRRRIRQERAVPVRVSTTRRCPTSRTRRWRAAAARPR